MSKLKLGKQTGTGAERTFEDDGRPREPHVLKPLASRKADEKGSRTLIIYGQVLLLPALPGRPSAVKTRAD